MRILVLSAFDEELASIRHDLDAAEAIMVSRCRCWKTKYLEHDIWLSIVGIGVHAAAATTAILCEQLHPDLIIFCGVAGGLKPELKIGDLIIATKVIDADLYHLPKLLQNSPYRSALLDPHTLSPIQCEYHIDNVLHRTMREFFQRGLVFGTIVTSQIFPAPEHLFSDTNLDGIAIDMESAGIYKAASYYKMPVLIMRAISNMLDADGNDLGTSQEALPYCAKQLSHYLEKILDPLIINALQKHKSHITLSV